MNAKRYNMQILTRKARFTVSLLLLSLSFKALAQEAKGALAQYEEIAHENPGCPENSECDAIMGMQMKNWKTLVAGFRNNDKPRALSEKMLQEFTTQNGWPSQFYARPEIRSTLAPILFSSSCALHNSKDPTLKLMRAEAFVKNVKEGSATIVKGKTEYKLKIGETIYLQQVIHHKIDKTQQIYWLPLGEKPLFIDGADLYTLVESEDFFSYLKSSPDGSWTLTLTPPGKAEDGLSFYYDQTQEVPCPEGAKKIPLPFGFQRTYCKSLPDKEGMKAGVMQYFWDCH
jgi:hypothetical protein